MTDAERRLWSALRQRRAEGFRFRRQQPIGWYIVDFFCPEARLVVEVDGSQHDDEERAWYDYRRTKWLQSKGYRVVRFTNYDVLRHPAEVTGAISDMLREAAPHPARRRAASHLPPQGGKGKN
jgi:very-short-patch-repair endonuclease